MTTTAERGMAPGAAPASQGTRARAESAAPAAPKKINLRRPEIMQAVQAQVISHYRSELVERTRASVERRQVQGCVIDAKVEQNRHRFPDPFPIRSLPMIRSLLLASAAITLSAAPVFAAPAHKAAVGTAALPAGRCRRCRPGRARRPPAAAGSRSSCRSGRWPCRRP